MTYDIGIVKRRRFISPDATHFVTPAAVAAGYQTTGVAFDASDDYLEKSGADLDGMPDTKAALFSCWFRVDGNAGAYRTFFESSDQLGVTIAVSNSDSIVADFYIPSYANRMLAFITAGIYGTNSAWRHVMFSSNGTTSHLYIDGAITGTTLNTADVTPDYDNNTHVYTVGGRSGGSLLWNGAFADIFFTNEYLDLSNSANRLKFYSASNKPVDLGVTGTTPTGTAPIVLLRASPTHGESVANFHTNKGTGGGFTLNGGGLSAASSDPSD